MIELALYQPDRPHNLGTLMRLCACTAVKLNIIEPCGFPLGDKRIRQGALDYQKWLDIKRHLSFDHFQSSLANPPRRLVLLSKYGSQPYHRFAFAETDTLLLGQESLGVPDSVHDAADERVFIPMMHEPGGKGPRSLNVAVAAAIVLGEALRQIGWLDRHASLSNDAISPT